MASSVTEIGRQVKQSEDITHAAVRQAEQTNERIAELSQAASRIGEVVSVQVIPRPHEDLGGILSFAKKAPASASSKNDGA